MEIKEEFTNCTVKDVLFRELITKGKSIEITDLTIDQTKELTLTEFQG